MCPSALVAKRLARERQEHRLEIGLLHLHGGNGAAIAGDGLNDRPECTPGVIDQEVDLGISCRDLDHAGHAAQANEYRLGEIPGAIIRT